MLAGNGYLESPLLFFTEEADFNYMGTELCHILKTKNEV